MTDLIPRYAKHEEAFMDAVWSALKADTSDLGKQQHILAAFRTIPTIDPAAIREAALREAEKIAEYHAARNCTASDVLLDIRRALIGEKK